ncbi:MAG: substrate-binding domain-containing protein [Cellulosilyticaceae bacterium]
MRKHVTMSDIANKLNISTVTVSKALSDKEGVSQTLRDQIKQVASEMGYRCNLVAKGMKEGCTYNVGVIVAKRYMDTANSFYWMMYQHLIQHLGKENYYALLEMISKEDEQMGKLPNMIEDRRVDALIILGQVKENYIDLIDNQGLPVLFLDFHSRQFDMDAVIGDNMYGSYMATNYLIGKGHKEIGYLGDIYATTSILDRYLGYSKALIENRLIIHPEWILKDRDADGESCLVELPEKLPTAFVCNCDKAAYYFVQQLESQGIRVPEDVSIVGFDDYIYATLSKPGITTIKVDIESMAEQAVAFVLRKLQDDSYTIGRKVIAGQIVIRESVKELEKN